MNTENKARIIGAIGTLLVALLVVLVLNISKLQLVVDEPSQHEKGEIAMVDEEMFVDVLDEPQPTVAGSEPASALTDEDIDNESMAAPVPGTDLKDNGPKTDASPATTTKQPSDVKQKVDPQAKPGAAKDNNNANEAIKRQAGNDVANAFKRSTGKNNANTSTAADNGPSGKTTGSSASSTVGSGTGTVGGGWKMPSYAKVPSTDIGVVNAIVKIDRNGNVISVSFSQGTPPAANNASVKRAVEQEIRRHKFTYVGAGEPQPATAYIKYTFIDRK